jgi:hypothetical protein
VVPAKWAARAIRTDGASFADRAGEVNSSRAKLFPTCDEGKLSTARGKPLQRHANWLFHDIMDAERIELAVQRIEAALARISAVADSAPVAPPSVAALVGKHDALRETVETTLAEIDALIGKLEQ